MYYPEVMNLPQGVLIVFEGGEGSGKTTQSKFAEEYLRSKRFLVHWTREPFDKNIRAKVLGLSEELCRDLTTEEELELFCEDRKNHVAEVIKPKLDEGYIVLCDRFEDSTVVYQGHARMNGDEAFIRYIREKSANARQGIEPDLVLLLDIDPETGIARKRAGKDTLTRFDKEEMDFHRKVNEGFRIEAERSFASRTEGSSWLWCIIDASLQVGTLDEDLTSDTVWRQVKRCIDSFFLLNFDINLQEV